MKLRFVDAPIQLRVVVPLALRWDGWLWLAGAGFLGGLVIKETP